MELTWQQARLRIPEFRKVELPDAGIQIQCISVVMGLKNALDRDREHRRKGRKGSSRLRVQRASSREMCLQGGRCEGYRTGNMVKEKSDFDKCMEASNCERAQIVLSMF